MSNSLAIAAVTATLRRIIDQGIRNELPGTSVTTKPLDKAETAANLINLFLYQMTVSAAWRNTDMPRQTKPGETGQPPLALNLYYLVTAYGKADESSDPPQSHRLLGRAMSALHDHPVLSSDDIKSALPVADQSLYDLYDQIEHVRITPQPLNLDEMSKLWTSFQAKYRISAAYLACRADRKHSRIANAAASPEAWPSGPGRRCPGQPEISIPDADRNISAGREPTQRAVGRPAHAHRSSS